MVYPAGRATPRIACHNIRNWDELGTWFTNQGIAQQATQKIDTFAPEKHDTIGLNIFQSDYYRILMDFCLPIVLLDSSSVSGAFAPADVNTLAPTTTATTGTKTQTNEVWALWFPELAKLQEGSTSCQGRASIFIPPCCKKSLGLTYSKGIGLREGFVQLSLPKRFGREKWEWEKWEKWNPCIVRASLASAFTVVMSRQFVELVDLIWSYLIIFDQHVGVILASALVFVCFDLALQGFQKHDASFQYPWSCAEFWSCRHQESLPQTRFDTCACNHMRDSGTL